MGGTAKPLIPGIRRLNVNAHSWTTPKIPLNKAIDPSKVLSEDKQYDLVYILKRSERNQDLKFSLRSVAKFCSFRNIWLVGYKPTWVKNVHYLPTNQNQDKWKNSIINYRAACECKDISDNFILMNDDFFALNPIYNWKENLNVCLGTLEDEVEKYKINEKRSRWQYAFEYAVELLDELNCKSHYDYESHVPIIINKKNFLEMLNKPEILQFNITPKVLHKRSVYKNLYPDTELDAPRKIKDVKITLKFDLSDSWLEEDWLSVFDDVVGNAKSYPKLNQYLSALFSEKCIFEV